MGIFDKIQDNAKATSMDALEQSDMHAPSNREPQSAEPEDFDEIDEEAIQEVAGQEPATLEDAPNGSELEYEDDEDDFQVKVTNHSAHKSEDKKPSHEPKDEKADDKPKTSSKEEAKSKAKAKDEDDDDEEEVVVTKKQAPAKSAAKPASRPHLEGTLPFYTTVYMNFRTNVFVNRVEYSGSFGKIVLPVAEIAWIKLRIVGTGIIIETTTGKRVVMIVKPGDRVRLCDAVLKAQEFALSNKSGRLAARRSAEELERLSTGIRELEKLVKLKDQGALTEEEFQAKKKQVLDL